MNRLFSTLLFILLASTTVLARNAERSIVEIRLSDDSPLTVSINGRDYKKYGRSITIGDLPKGRHDLRVYEFVEYKRGGGKAKLLYTGRIKITAGTINYCEVDIRTGNMRVKTGDLNALRNINGTGSSNVTTGNISQTGTFTTAEMDDLQLLLIEQPTDIEKLKTLKSSLEKKTFYTNQVRTVAGWLAFEESKLDFIKWAYKNTIDKTEYASLENIFTMEENKNLFKKSIQ